MANSIQSFLNHPSVEEANHVFGIPNYDTFAAAIEPKLFEKNPFLRYMPNFTDSVTLRARDWGTQFFNKAVGKEVVENTNLLYLRAYQFTRVALICLSLHPSFVVRITGGVLRFAIESLLVETKRQAVESKTPELKERSIWELGLAAAEVAGGGKFLIPFHLFATCFRIN